MHDNAHVFLIRIVKCFKKAPQSAGKEILNSECVALGSDADPKLKYFNKASETATERLLD